MHKLSVIIDHSGGAPAVSVRAEEVEWNDPDWDIVVAGKSVLGVIGSETDPVGHSELWWYHFPIAVSKHYSIYVDGGAGLVEGYEGKYIDSGDKVATIAANAAHAALVASNPHVVTTTELSLENVENYTALNQVANGLTVAIVKALGLTLNDITSGVLQASEVAAQSATLDGSFVIYQDSGDGSLKVELRHNTGTSSTITLAVFDG